MGTSIESLIFKKSLRITFLTRKVTNLIDFLLSLYTSYRNSPIQDTTHRVLSLKFMRMITSVLTQVHAPNTKVIDKFFY